MILVSTWSIHLIFFWLGFAIELFFCFWGENHLCGGPNRIKAQDGPLRRSVWSQPKGLPRLALLKEWARPKTSESAERSWARLKIGLTSRTA